MSPGHRVLPRFQLSGRRRRGGKYSDASPTVNPCFEPFSSPCCVAICDAAGRHEGAQYRQRNRPVNNQSHTFLEAEKQGLEAQLRGFRDMGARSGNATPAAITGQNFFYWKWGPHPAAAPTDCNAPWVRDPRMAPSAGGRDLHPGKASRAQLQHVFRAGDQP